MGKMIYLVSGTGAGQMRHVVSNTANVITVDANWTTNPSTDTVYTIGTDTSPSGTRDINGTEVSDGPRVEANTTDQTFSVKINAGEVSLGFTFYDSYWT